jgi:hypothetical protein
MSVVAGGSSRSGVFFYVAGIKGRALDAMRDGCVVMEVGD